MKNNNDTVCTCNPGGGYNFDKKSSQYKESKAHLFIQSTFRPVSVTHNPINTICSLYFPKENIIFQAIKVDTGNDGEETKYRIRKDNQSTKRFKSLIGQTSLCMGEFEYLGEINFKQKELNGLKKLVKIYEEKERLQKKISDLETKEYGLEIILANIEAKATI